MSVELRFDRGTLAANLDTESISWASQFFSWDPRTSVWRAPAFQYRDILTTAVKAGEKPVDLCRNYGNVTADAGAIQPREHQAAALTAWEAAGGRGVVCLPTGAGKSILAILAIAKVKRTTLILVPTIDLLIQWYGLVQEYHDGPVGRLGGGWREIEPITVATYDSALIHLDRIGSTFGTHRPHGNRRYRSLRPAVDTHHAADRKGRSL